jgi:PKD repeat protein
VVLLGVAAALSVVPGVLTAREPDPSLLRTTQELIESYRSFTPPVVEPVPVVQEMTAPLVESASGVVNVRCMPASFSGTCGSPAPYAWPGRSFPIWGNVRGGRAPYTYRWDFDDGTPPATGTVANANYIAVLHTYTGLGPKFAELLVTDADGTSDSCEVRIDVAPVEQQVRVNAAIQDGLRYLYIQQGSDGRWNSGQPHAATAAAVAAFEIQGHLPANDPEEDIYTERVQLGLQYLFDGLVTQELTPCPNACSEVDLNDNGLGVRHVDYYYQGYTAYTQGLVMLAIAASLDSSATASAGPAGVIGRSYRDILVDMVDQLAWSQTDTGGGRGGWRYAVQVCNYGSDNSAVQWASIGLAAAAGPPWNIQATQCLKDELEIWLDYSQCAGDGGFGYTGPCQSNHARTGSGLYSHFCVGTPVTDPRVQAALGYLNSTWCAAGCAGAMDGDFYATYAVKKSLEDYRIATVGTHDWRDEFEKHLVKGLNCPCNHNNYHQITDTGNLLTDGRWADCGTLNSYGMSTAAALLCLSSGVTCPSPVAVCRVSPDSICVGAEGVWLDANGSRPIVCGAEVIDWSWDTDEDGQEDLSGPYVYFDTASLAAGNYPITLTVTDDSGCSPGTSQCVLVIGGGNHAPVPVPGGPYTACVGDTIRPDACASFDPDRTCAADSIVQWCWDFDGNGNYVCFDTCRPDTFFVFDTEIYKVWQLKVVDSQGAVSDPAGGVVEVWTSLRELSVGPEDIQLQCPSAPADSLGVTVTIHAATQVPDLEIPAANIEVFLDDSTATLPVRRVCQAVSTPLHNGETFTFSCDADLPDDLPHLISVRIDRQQLIRECDETDNLAHRWTCEGGLASLVIHDDLVGFAGHPVTVPVYATTDSSIGIVQFVVGYDSEVLHFRGVDPGGDVPGFSVSQINPIAPFAPHCADADSNLLVQLSGSGATYFNGADAEIALLRFDVAGAPGDSTTLCFGRDPGGSFLTTANLHDIVDPELTFSDGLLHVDWARYKLSGDVTYCGNRGVPLTLVTAQGVDSLVAKTDAQGRYSMTLREGHYDLGCSKSNDRRNAIGGNDAVLVLEHLALLDTLQGCAFLAADVTEDGVLRGSDALAIFQYAIDSTSTVAHCGAWRFVPASAGVDIGVDTEQDFLAYLLGDANLSWSLDGAVASKVGGRIASEATTAIVVQESWDEAAGRLQIGLALRSRQAPVRSTLFTLRYDTEALRFAGWSRTTSEPGVLALVREGADAQLRGGMASARPLALERDLILLEFEVRRPGVPPAWEFTRAQLDDRPVAVAQSGRAPDDPTRVPPPAHFVLGQNHPNPFNATTAIRVGVPAADLAGAVLQIFDAQGRVLRQLDLSKLAAGWHDVLWDGLSDRGRPVSSGVYFYAVRWRGAETARKMILIE